MFKKLHEPFIKSSDVFIFLESPGPLEDILNDNIEFLRW